MPRAASSKIPAGYGRLPGSERAALSDARRVGPAPADETVRLTVILRRRPNGPGVPDHLHYLGTPPSQRRRLSEDEFAERYGYDEADAATVTEFARSRSLEVTGTHAGRRAVYLSGTVAQVSKAFGVSLNVYERAVEPGRRGEPERSETYRGREGFIHVPSALVEIVVGVFGLDNRSVTHRNLADPPSTTTITLAEVRQLYDFPTNQAVGQTIAIFSTLGYLASDISANFGGNPPTVTDIPIDASNGDFPDDETTQDIFISGSCAPGADIAVYFTTGSQQGWVDLVGRVVHPDPGDPVCSVLSSSFYIMNGDDAALSSGATSGLVDAVSQAFEDAAIQGVTICIASGDTGSESKIADGKAHVQYPGSDPWVLSCGGTTIGSASGSSCDEWAWIDSFSFGGSPTFDGATGGGVSAIFPLPYYQVDAAVPPSVNDGHLGRGVPDVAANASPNSGYPIILGGSLSPWPANGTSASAPLWAGLIAVLNAALGENVGFVNPVLYALGSSVFRDIVSELGAADNSLGGTPGYPVGPGWDACTGWGSPRGQALLAGLRRFYGPAIAVSPQDDLEFGVVCHEPRYLTLKVYNVGSRDLMILKVHRISGSSAFSVLPAPATPLAIAPGSEIDFTIKYAPTTPGSTGTATIQVVSNDPLHPTLDLVTAGTDGHGTLETVIADHGNFGACCVGSFVDENLTLANDGPCALSITSLTSSDPDFLLPSANSYPLKLATGTSIQLPIRFQPATHGTKTGTVIVHSDDPAGAKTVHVSGHAPTGQLAVSGSTHFGGVRACHHEDRTIWLSNVGECQLHVSSVAFRHPSKHWTLVNDPFPAILHPGALLPLVIRYHATERYARAREILITSDDPHTPVHTLEVLAHTVWNQCCDHAEDCCCGHPGREPECCDCGCGCDEPGGEDVARSPS
jgi:kumamolisin